jgi:hypothetical protein
MSGNEALLLRQRSPQDDWYTLMPDIESELSHYPNAFRGKVVYCNCDDPYESNFFQYFIHNFRKLGLKRLLTTCYAGAAPAMDGRPRRACKAVINEVPEGVVHVDELARVAANTLSLLDGDGDFRSDECAALLAQSDVVVTNPPWSLFAEFVPNLLSHKKGFVVLGPTFALVYARIFPFIRSGAVQVGYNSGGSMRFRVVRESQSPGGAAWEEVYLRTGRAVWFTNLEKVWHAPLPLATSFSPHIYPRYVNYDAIEVGRLCDIPRDYYGPMGVPVTFLTRYCNDQFILLGRDEDLAIPISQFACTGTYGGPPRRNFYLRNADGTLRTVFRRVVIKRVLTASSAGRPSDEPTSRLAPSDADTTIAAQGSCDL